MLLLVVAVVLHQLWPLKLTFIGFSLSLSYLFIIIFFLLNLVARSQFQKAKRLQPYVHNFK